jgi:hypothetical protein
VAFGAEEDSPILVRWGQKTVSSKELANGDHGVHGAKAGADVTAARNLYC